MTDELIPPPIDRIAAAKAIDAFLRAIGRDPKTERELKGTGVRVAAAFIDELCAGYDVDIPKLVAEHTLSIGTGASVPSVVVLREIHVGTVCPHHLLPAHGIATIAYAPRERLMGVGALPLLVDAAAQRLTLQETIGVTVAAALSQGLQAKWTACLLRMSHLCMTMRTPRKTGTSFETFAFQGDDALRMDAYRICTS